MNLNDQFHRYFGTVDLSSLPAAAVAAGVERMQVDLGLEKDRGRRFALWALLHMLDAAPDLDVAFANERDREAARAFMDLANRPEVQHSDRRFGPKFTHHASSAPSRSSSFWMISAASLNAVFAAGTPA